MFTRIKFLKRNAIIKNFSLFSKIKQHNKSDELAVSEAYNSFKNIDQDNIFPEYESEKNKVKKSGKKLTPEELEILKNLPKQTISNDSTIINYL